MSPIELTLLGCSLLFILVIFILEVPGARGLRFTNLPPSMLFFLRIALGIVFAILGVVGSLLPIMQGWIFFLLAVLVLFPQSAFAIKACNKIEPRMPRMVGRLRRWGIGIPPPQKVPVPEEGGTGTHP